MATVVSLFSGCGGLDLGFKELGFEILYACDNDLAAVNCYARNVDSCVYLRDVNSAEFHADIAAIGGCDVILGGFPCQGFSKAGPKNLLDKRNVLYVEMKHAIEALQPQVFIAENVDGMSQNFNGIFLRRIMNDFAELGYAVEQRILDAVSYGLPQYRRRVFFVGVKKPLSAAFSWPLATHRTKPRNGEFRVAEVLPLELFPNYQEAFAHTGRTQLKNPTTLFDAIGDIADLNATLPDHRVTNAWPKKYYTVFRTIGVGQKLCNVRHAATSVHTWQIPDVFGFVTERERLILETIGTHRRHKKYGSIPNGNPLPIIEVERLCGLEAIQTEIEVLLGKGYLKLKDGKYDLLGAMFCSGLFKRPLWNEPAPTVLTNFHNPRYFLHPDQDRPFSLRECARLQGFSDTFIFTTTSSKKELIDGYRLVGNAVPPPLSRELAKATLQFLAANERQALQA